MGEALPYVRKTKRRPSITRKAKIAAISCGAVAVSLGFGGLYLNQQETIAANAAAAAEYTPAPLPSQAPSATPTPPVTRSDLAALVTGPEDVVISVLGDSTGNGYEEWVGLWAEHLTQYGTVTLHMWDEVAGGWNPEPRVLSGGAKSITIWNGSQPGSTYTYPLERLDAIQPEQPSFTIVNFGHNIAAKPADVGAAELLAAVDAKWGATLPAAITLQNPAQGEREPRTASSVKALAAWAPRTGYTTINVNEAFTEAGPIDSLLQDDVHPNPAGSQVWADTVSSTLG